MDFYIYARLARCQILKFRESAKKVASFDSNIVHINITIIVARTYILSYVRTGGCRTNRNDVLLLVFLNKKRFKHNSTHNLIDSTTFLLFLFHIYFNRKFFFFLPNKLVQFSVWRQFSIKRNVCDMRVVATQVNIRSKIPNQVNEWRTIILLNFSTDGSHIENYKCVECLFMANGIKKIRFTIRNSFKHS